MSAAPGWYADPLHPSALRWWDGHAWTPTTSAPGTHALPPATTGPRHPRTPAGRRRPRLAWTLPAVALLGAVAWLGVPRHSDPASPATAATASAAAPITPVQRIVELTAASCTQLEVPTLAEGVGRRTPLPAGAYHDPGSGLTLQLPWAGVAVEDRTGGRVLAARDPYADRSISVDIRPAAGDVQTAAAGQACGAGPAVAAAGATLTTPDRPDGPFRGLAAGPELAAVTLTRRIAGSDITVVLLGARGTVLGPGGDAPALALLATTVAPQSR